MSKSTNKPTTSFWVISVIALIWNILGVVAYLGQAYMTDEILATLPEAEQLYYANMPPWVTAAFATAVFGGLLGCISLLIKKKMAYFLFILSLIAVIIQATYNFVIQNDMPVETFQMIWSLVVILVAAFLVYFSSKSIKAGMIS